MMMFLKKFQLIIFLSFLAGSLLVIKAGIKPEIETEKNVEQNIIPTLAPVITPTPTTAEEASNQYEIIADQLMPLWRLLPYQGEGFVVENYAKEGVLIISLKEGTTKNEAMLAIGNWMLSNEVDPNTHELEWK